MKPLSCLFLSLLLLSSFAGCATNDDSDKPKPRDMSTQQPVPPPAPPVGRTVR